LIVLLVFAKLTPITNLPILIINVFFIIHIGKIKKANRYEDFEPELKKVALATFALSILIWISFLYK
jgi:1,4-dihydroxy-2-naphthoate octaprenyltransferase